MFSVVVRGSWLIMEVVSGHVAYAALLCVLKPKRCTTSWKKRSSLWWHKALQLGLTWRDEAKSLAICHTLRELLIISALDNKCTLVRTRTKLKIHDYLQLRTELRGGRNGQKVGVECFSSFRVLHPIYFKTRPTALSWKIDYLKLKILQLPRLT